MNIKKTERDIFELRKKNLNKHQEESIHKIKEHAQHMLVLLSKLKSSRELSLAQSRLEEAVMWAIKSVVIHEGDQS